MESGGDIRYLPVGYPADFRTGTLGHMALLRLAFLAAGVTANVLFAAANAGTDFWTHIDVWAPAVNTALLIYLYRSHRKIERTTDEVRDVAKEGVDELKAIHREHDSHTPPK